MWSVAQKFLKAAARRADPPGRPAATPPPDPAPGGADAKGPDAPGPDATSPDGTGSPAPSPTGRLEARLRDAVARGETAIGGRVNLLNLSRLAERYGERWPLLADKVDQLIRLTLTRRLSPRDVFSRFDDGVYIIMLDGLSEAEARLKCALLADEIAGKLLGQTSSLDAIDVCCAVAPMDGALALRTTDVAGALNEVLANAQQYSARDARDAAAAKRAGDADGAADGVAADGVAADGVFDGVARAVSAARSQLAALPDAPGGGDVMTRLECMLELLRQAEAALVSPGAAPGDGGAEDARLGAVRALIGRAEAVLRDRHVGLQDATVDADALASANLSFLYRPMWHVSRRVINAYLCEPAAHLGRRYIVGDALLPDQADSQLVATLDRTVLRKALEDAVELLKSGRRSVVVVPVHHSTLVGGRATRDYTALCRAVEPTLRPSLVWEILEPASSLSGLQVAPLVATLRPFGRAVLVRVDIDRARFDDFVGLAAYSVGTDVGSLALPEPQIVRKIELFRARAARYGLRSYLHGVASTSLLAAAVGAGFDYVDGRGLMPHVAAPGPVEPFDLYDLYAQRFPDAAG